jgi:hypothetical protein
MEGYDMKPLMRSVIAGVAVTLAFALGASGAIAAEKPDPKEVHKTKPGEKYEPTLDVLPGTDTKLPGAEEGVPTLTEAQFGQANKIYFERCAGSRLRVPARFHQLRLTRGYAQLGHVRRSADF